MLLAWLGILVESGVAADSDSDSEVNARPPNVVFILADDLGVFDLGCYGRKDHRTPHLDRLAASGTRFTSAYCAQPICSPSRAAIITGQTPARLHLTTYLPGRPNTRSQRVLHPVIRQQLPWETSTMAEVFRDAGYATACIGKWHLGGAGYGPEKQGFETVYAGRANTTPSAEEGGKGEFDLTARAESFIEANRERPFLLYLAHNSPHIPYSARPEHAGSFPRAFEPVYAAVVESLDASVGRLLARLKTLGLESNTMVIFTSDNGGLHVPELKHVRVTHNGAFRAGKGFLYEGGLRIPLLVRWPGRVPEGRVVDTPVVNTDWLPTLRDLCGLRTEEGIQWDGVSFAKLLTGGSGRTRPLFWHFPHYTNQGGRPGGVVREGRWKLIEFYDTGDRELYDLASDLGEKRSVAENHPGRVRRMARQLDAWLVAVGAQTNAPNPQFEQSSFRALYVDLDPSRFHPREASPAEWERMAAWRLGMDSVTAR